LTKTFNATPQQLNAKEEQCLHFGMWLQVMSISTGILDGKKYDIIAKKTLIISKILKL